MTHEICVGKEEKETVERIVHGKLKFPKMRRRVTEQCKRLISGLLEKDPKKRLTLHSALESDWAKMG